jgi:hypothetical protein
MTRSAIVRLTSDYTVPYIYHKFDTIDSNYLIIKFLISRITLILNSESGNPDPLAVLPEPASRHGARSAQQKYLDQTAPPF